MTFTFFKFLLQAAPTQVATASGVAGGYPAYTNQQAAVGYQQAPAQPVQVQQYQQNTGYGMCITSLTQKDIEPRT